MLREIAAAGPMSAMPNDVFSNSHNYGNKLVWCLFKVLLIQWQQFITTKPASKCIKMQICIKEVQPCQGQ